MLVTDVGGEWVPKLDRIVVKDRFLDLVRRGVSAVLKVANLSLAASAYESRHLSLLSAGRKLNYWEKEKRCKNY